MKENDRKNIVHKEYYQEDEINLLDLWNTLVAGKKWIIYSVLFTLALAVTYLFLVANEYEAEVYMRPPTFKDIEVLHTVNVLDTVNVLNTVSVLNTINVNTENSKANNGDDAVTPLDVYSVFLTNIQSRKIKNFFYDKLDVSEFFPAGSTKKVKVNFEKKKTKLDEIFFTKLSLVSPEKENIAKWANDYVQIAIEETKSILLKDAESKLALIKENLERQIATLRKSAIIKRKDNIERLKESLLIASSLGIISPMDTSVEMSTFEKSENPGTPKFYQGITALQQEIDILQSRKNDDAFIPKLRDLENKLSLYQSINFDRKKLQVVNIDEWAFEPINPVKPKKYLVLVLSVISGLMFGILLVFVQKIFDKKQAT